MAKFDAKMVDDLAEELLIGLTREENKMVLDEFEAIDANINLINEIEGLREVEAMTHALDDFEGEMEEDIVEDSITIEEVLRNAKGSEGREIEIPKVVE